jgi:hypothetical protein
MLAAVAAICIGWKFGDALDDAIVLLPLACCDIVDFASDSVAPRN